MMTTKFEQFRLHLESWQSRQDKPIFGRFVDPPYEPTTVKIEVNALRERCNKSLFNLNDARVYAAYLERRFPMLGAVTHGVEERLPNYEDVDSYLKALLETHERTVDRKRSAARRLRRRLSVRRRCQLCSFDYPPLLHLHHLVPLTEGGDNETLVVLCPTCHAGVHELTKAAVKALTKTEIMALAWWQKNQDRSNWWKQAGEGVTELVDLYVKHFEYESYRVFVDNLSSEELNLRLYRMDEREQLRLLPLSTSGV